MQENISPVKLQVLDSRNADGSVITKVFGFDYAQRILNVRNQSSWGLADTNYKLVNGIITPIPPAEAVQVD
jgi:hypothetical protein